MTHSMNPHIVKCKTFCQEIVHVFYFDLLKSISRKAWLKVLAVQINEKTKIACFLCPDLKMFIIYLKLIIFFIIFLTG